MLTCDQKNAPTAGAGAKATAAASLDGGHGNYHLPAMPGPDGFFKTRLRIAIVEPALPDVDSKAIATLAAKFALAGHEMRVIERAGRRHFEVRRWGQCRAVSSLHDLQGFLTQISGAGTGARSHE